jgi:rod shape-determining protein MreD
MSIGADLFFLHFCILPFDFCLPHGYPVAMNKAPLIVPFLLALVAALFSNAFLPSVPLFAFAPFIAVVVMRKRLFPSLWLALLSGLIIDLLNTESRFGWYAMTYTATTFLIYSQRTNFFDDKPSALALFTALISAVSTAIQMAILFGIRKKLPFSWGLIFTDLFGMSFLDALYAFLWFTCSLALFNHIKRLRWRSKLREVEE